MEKSQKLNETAAGRNLLEVRGLKTFFTLNQTGNLIFSKPNILKAVDDIDLTIENGTTLGLVGESGSGKSTVARSILQLVRPTAGEVLFEGHNLCQLKAKSLRPLRKRMQIIFQDPYASLDPRQTIGFTVGEPLLLHKLCSKREFRERVRSLLELVGLDPDLENRYPHEFSGGQRQRVGIARSLATNPDFIVADEPISSLDVSIQAQILNLLNELQKRLHLTYLFISHDLRAVRYLSDQVAVMYLGKVVEIGPTQQLFEHPSHPYTRLLLESAPVARWQTEAIEREKKAIKGELAGSGKPLVGCPFAARCPQVMERCRKETPFLETVEYESDHKAACFLVSKV
jgi:oligopeptide/dipeptide ABC transporter ATP-binding protein